MKFLAENTTVNNYLVRQVCFSCCILWFLWVLANLAGEVLQMFSLFATPMFGIFQWLVLRKYVRHSGWWILASAYGWLVSYLLINLLQLTTRILEIVPQGELVVIGINVNIQAFWLYILIMSLTSAVIGIFQWLVLQNYISDAGWWIFASSIGGVTKGFVLAVAPQTIESIITYLIGSVAYAAITGIALVFLLKNRIKYRLKQQMYWIK